MLHRRGCPGRGGAAAARRAGASGRTGRPGSRGKTRRAARGIRRALHPEGAAPLEHRCRYPAPGAGNGRGDRGGCAS